MSETQSSPQAEAPAQLTFTPINKNAPGAIITRCQGWLPNRMQCTRSGEFQASNGLQYCGAHMRHLQAGIQVAPVSAIFGTGTVQSQPVPPELFQIKTPQGETITINEQPTTNITTSE